uniref:Voltage-gated purine nucleotide uniporter SLC17A9 n=1 Tax=Sinocyclocheilus grahami TaxID=75366 RepID=A0A672LAV0_SINGR
MLNVIVYLCVNCINNSFCCEHDSLGRVNHSRIISGSCQWTVKFTSLSFIHLSLVSPLARTWTLMLLLVTCLLYWSRMAMPICAVTMAKEFGWSKTETGIVLGAFFWGYCFTQVLGGHASDRIGGERVLLLSTSSWAVMTAITPLLANIGLRPLVTMTVTRFLLGVMQGVHYPSLVSICAQRVKEGERGLLMSTLACGCYLGMLLVGGVGSLMLDWFGWGSVFYGAGLLGVCWTCCVWKCLLQGPSFSLDSLWISSSSTSESSKVNWLNLLREPSVWAMIIAHLCFSSTNYTLMSWLPTFFKDMFPYAKDWVFNVIPWFVALPTSLFGGSISDHLIRQGEQNQHNLIFFAMGVASVFIFLLCKTDSFIHAVVCVSLAVGLSTFNNSGVSVNVHDQAPSCAGALFGESASTCLLLVYTSGYMIEVTGSWVNVFSVLAVVNVIGVTIFIVLGEAKRVDQLYEHVYILVP